MEGTKNERSVVIVLSYIIGFITGFILLNNYQNENSTNTLVYTDSNSNIANTSNVGEEQTNESVYLSYSQKTNALISNNGEFIFYCEKLNPENNFCYGYIYQRGTDMVHQVSLNNSPLSITEEVLSSTKWIDDRLTIGDIVSVNLTEPWLLVDTPDSIDLEY